MTRTLMLVSALTLALSPLMAATSFTCTASTIAVGETWTEGGDYNSSLTIHVFDSARELPAIIGPATNVTRTKTMTITGVNGTGSSAKISSVEATYSAASLPAVVGNTYSISSDGSVSYAPPSTGTPSSAEIAYVAGDNSHFGQFRAFNRIFGGQTFTEGEGTRHINKNDAEELINPSADVDVDSIDVNFVSVLANGGGSFGVDVTLHSNMKSNSKPGDEEPTATAFTGKLTMGLTGTFDVNPATCRPARVLLQGSNTLQGSRAAGKGKDVNMTVTGDGSVSINASYTFPSAP